MIFATIGTQAPFDRFIKILDEIAPMSNELIIAQTYKGRYQPKNIKTIDFLAPDEFDKLCHDARLIVAHAGMGTIISAMTKGKPIIVFPRIAARLPTKNRSFVAFPFFCKYHSTESRNFIYQFSQSQRECMERNTSLVI